VVRIGWIQSGKLIMAIVTTIYGDMDESFLRKVEGQLDNDNEFTTWVEYYQGDELVHRSVHVTLKKMPEFVTGDAGSIG